jgi:toxin YhaV
MANRREGGERRQGERRRGAARQPVAARPEDGAIEVNGWTILAHPLFLDAIEVLVNAVEAEQAERPGSAPSGNAKLLAHLLDLAFDRIPRDPGNPAFRHGGTRGENRKHWFRGKTGNGRYRLFYRFRSAAGIMVYAWVNDENSLRSYGSRSDAYGVFAGMLTYSPASAEKGGSPRCRHRRSPRGGVTDAHCHTPP